MSAQHIPDGVNIEPTEEQMAAFLKGDREEAVMMVNLLAFYDRAIYPPDSDFPPCSGREAYMKYGAHAQEKLESIGGRIFFSAPCQHTTIGRDEGWDMIAIAYYPSRRAFIDLAVAMGEHAEAITHRRAGLKKTIVIQTPANFEGGVL